MTARQKKGIGFLVTSALFALGGGVLLGTAVTPDWVTVIMTVVSAVSSVFGIVITAKPDV
jgi:hypothetical protein